MELNSAGHNVQRRRYPGLDYGLSSIVDIIDSRNMQMDKELVSERRQILDPDGQIDGIWTRAVGKATEDESQNDVDFILFGYRPNVGLQADIGPVLLTRKTVVSDCIQQAGPVEEKFMRAYEMLKFVLKERSLVVQTLEKSGKLFSGMRLV